MLSSRARTCLISSEGSYLSGQYSPSHMLHLQNSCVCTRLHANRWVCFWTERPRMKMSRRLLIPSLCFGFLCSGLLAHSTRSRCHQSVGDSLQSGNSALHWTESLNSLLLSQSGDSYTLCRLWEPPFTISQRGRTQMSHFPSNLGRKVQP